VAIPVSLEGDKQWQGGDEEGGGLGNGGGLGRHGVSKPRERVFDVVACPANKPVVEWSSNTW